MVTHSKDPILFPNSKNEIHFITYANSVLESESMAGGYRIFIECLRHWLNQGHTAELITSQQGQILINRYLNSPNLQIKITGPSGPMHNPGFRSLGYSGLLYLARTVNGIYRTLRCSRIAPGNIIYSTTPFLPDIFPALISHLRNPGTLWLVAFSMFAPPILGGWYRDLNSQAKFIEKRALALKINEILVYPVIKRWADIVYLNNDLDAERIISSGIQPERTIVIGGGVDVEMSNSVLPIGDIKYDAIFIGRFHPQKGVLELVDIWEKVCEKLPEAKLVMIGNGPLEDEVANKIQRMKLDRNINLVGFKDGIEKIKIIRQSRIVLHPSLYDSGGMAAAEAMVCGLPGVSFDLPALRTYYPKGMLKAKDPNEFARHIILLLTKTSLYNDTSREAHAWAILWDWRCVAKQLLAKCQTYVQEPRSELSKS